MNGGDKILSRIKSDCDETVKAITDKAQKERELSLAQARKTADENARQIAEKTKQRIAQLNASSKSRAELEIRNTLLKKRRQEIDKTVDALLRYMLDLNTTDYFGVIYCLAAKLKGMNGEVFLNKKDLARVPADFIEQMKNAGVDAALSDKTVNIKGGFILKNGGIEENMDFAAIIAAKRDEIEDLINRELFAE